MGIRHESRQAVTRRLSNTYLFTRRPQSITAVKIAPQLYRCDHCARQVPRLVLHVERLDGGSTDACRSCFLRLAANEAHDRLVANWHGLFRHTRPWVFGLRGAPRVEVAYAY